MFPTTFDNDAKLSINTHQAIIFSTNLTKTKVVSMIKSMGIAKFLNPDKEKETIYSSMYKDDRIVGKPEIVSNANCCAFTKAPHKWFLFPFSKLELAAVGITEDDLIRWIRYLNGLKVGFKYLYFGLQEASEEANIKWVKGDPGRYTPIPKNRYNENNFYWVGVPAFSSSTHAHIPYVHWIYLRYLINDLKGNGNLTQSTAARILSYYNIPRVLFYLVDHLGVTPWKAFMYTMAAFPWYSSFGVTWADYNGNGYNPDLGISSSNFKKLWANHIGLLNNMLLPSTASENHTKQFGFKLVSKHDPLKCVALTKKGQMKEFVEYMDSVYYPSKKKTVKNTTSGKTSKRAVNS